MMITIDFETKSYADLKKVGAWVYSQHPTTEVICVCWGVDSQPIREWWPGHPDGNPLDLFKALEECDTFEAHNLAFELSMWINNLVPLYGWPMPDLNKSRDTMATACYYGLPAALDKLAMALGFQGKDKDGGRLITKYSKLNLKTAKPEIPEEDFRKFVEYCKQDVRIEQSVGDYLGELPERELPLFRLDQRVNMRGLFLDTKGIEKATEVVEKRSLELTEEFKRIVGFGPSQHGKVLDWFHSKGLKLENLQAEYLEEVIDDTDLPDNEVRRAIELRLEVNKASTKKLDAMARQCGSDGRARFQTRYHGAVTGRNTGAGFQPLNLNRGYDPQDKISPEQLVRDIWYGDPRWLDAVYGDAMDAVAKASRHWIMAAPEAKIVSGDYVSVEAVILACLAGEDWKIDAFRRKEKIYERMADKIYNLPPGTVTKDTHPLERQDGKTGELAFGYQGALNAWLKFDRSGRHSEERIIEICKAWRLEHPAVVQLWAELEEAAIEAVEFKGRVTGYREIGFECVDEWLTMILPDGKRLWYFKPQLRLGMPQWHQPLVKPECAADKCSCRPRIQLTYLSPKGGTLRRVNTYGGKLTENGTQAVSRQILAPAVLALDNYGYNIILTVYDEAVAEVPKGFGSVKEFVDIMLNERGKFSRDWPISAEGWEGQRYKK